MDLQVRLSLPVTTTNVGDQKFKFGLQGGGTQYIREFWNLYFYIYKTERCVCLSACLSVCLLPFSSQTTGWIWTKLGMDLPMDPGNVLHILFWGYPHQGGYDEKLKIVKTFPSAKNKII